MDKLEKALRKLSQKEKDRLKIILSQLVAGDLLGLDIRKLKGREDIFRVSKGDLRIIYRKEAVGKIDILAIRRRKEDTYKF